MLRFLSVALVVLFGFAGYLLVRPTQLAQPVHRPLLGSLSPSSTPRLAEVPGSAPTVSATAAQPIRTTVSSAHASAVPPRSSSLPSATVLPFPAATATESIAPSAIGAGYGLDPQQVRTLVFKAGLPANPIRGAAKPVVLKKQPLLHLPRVLPVRTVTVPILMYHHVSSLPAATELNAGLTVTDSDFAAQLGYLRAHGYHTVLLRQVFAALYQHVALPAHPIVLTFDDGYLDNYTDALPILLKAHDVAEFNIISAYPGITLGVNSYMTWGQLKRLVADGMEIGSHTVDHQDLGTLPEDHIRFELRDSRNILQQKLGVPVQFLAYPSGEPFSSGTLAAQQELLTLLPEYGYVGALCDGPITSSAQDAQQPFKLWRIRVSGGEGLADFTNSLL